MFMPKKIEDALIKFDGYTAFQSPMVLCRYTSKQRHHSYLSKSILSMRSEMHVISTLTHKYNDNNTIANQSSTKKKLNNKDRNFLFDLVISAARFSCLSRV